MSSILVTGKNGQLGSELQKLAPSIPNVQFHFKDSAELNIADADQVIDAFDAYKPSVCINGAAYTAVDKAETEKELSMQINADAVGLLAQQCKKHSTRFIHVSTDYVFDGTASTPYKEDNHVNPVNYYGLTKLKGEQMAMSRNEDSIIIRTSWVYSSFGNNFVKTMVRLMQERKSLNVVNDQFGSPTYAADLAAAILKIATAEKTKGGIYHFSNEGIISWFDFAVAIKELAEMQCEVEPIPTSAYPTPAKRPSFSAFDKTKIKSIFGIEPRNWVKALKECIALLKQ